jgi:hypothetical protein
MWRLERRAFAWHAALKGATNCIPGYALHNVLGKIMRLQAREWIERTRDVDGNGQVRSLILRGREKNISSSKATTLLKTKGHKIYCPLKYLFFCAI